MIGQKSDRDGKPKVVSLQRSSATFGFCVFGKGKGIAYV